MDSLAYRLVIIAVCISMLQVAQTAPNKADAMSKVFNYQGMLLIKDDRTGEIIKADGNQTESATVPPELAEAEAACWNMINEQSGEYHQKSKEA